MLTLSGEYAMQSMVFIASRPKNDHVLAREIAIQLKIPRLYLSKILQHLSRKGMLHSQRGRRGGFALARPAEDITVMEIMETVGQATRLKRCLLGLRDCHKETPCPMHESWQTLRNQIESLFGKTTLGDLVERLEGQGPAGAFSNSLGLDGGRTLEKREVAREKGESLAV